MATWIPCSIPPYVSISASGRSLQTFEVNAMSDNELLFHIKDNPDVGFNDSSRYKTISLISYLNFTRPDFIRKYKVFWDG